MNNKGSNTIQMFILVFAIFFGALFLGLALWGFNLIDSVLDQNIEVGQVNLQDINNKTFAQFNDAFVSRADLIGVVLLLGMSFMMILNAYFFGSDKNKIWFVVDILILIFVFILAVYMSQSYETFINADPLIEAIYIDSIPKTSTFMLNLPTYIGTIGAVILIVSYAGFRKRTEEVNIYGT